MKYLFLLLLLLITVSSCKKDNSDTKMPDPSCDDASDDGKYENWNTKQLESIYPQFPDSNSYKVTFYDHELAGAPVNIHFEHERNSSTCRVSFIQRGQVDMIFSRGYPFANPGSSLMSWAACSDRVGDTVVRILPAVSAAPKGSCARFYYILLDKQKNAVTKGHFDFEL